MRLPHDRILHIDTEIKEGKVNVMMEWQGELVRCKDCRHYEKFNYEAPSGYDGWCYTPVIYADGHYTNALHFCSYGERKGGDDE